MTKKQKKMLIRICIAIVLLLIAVGACAFLYTQGYGFPTQESVVQQLFNDPGNESMAGDVAYISRLCDQNNIPFASNIATAEMLILGLARGDLDWRDIVHPQN